MKCGWHVPVVPASWEAEWFEPRNLKSAWATYIVKGNLTAGDFILMLHVGTSRHSVRLILGTPFLLYSIAMPWAPGSSAL